MSALRVVTTAAWLKPFGGVERCTLEDCVALAARGTTIDLLYWVDGPQRHAYQDAGVNLVGPINFGFSPWRPVHHLRHFAAAGRVMRSLRPDVLWLNRAEHIVWANAVAAQARIPIVCQLHQVPNFRHTRQLYAPVAHFVAVSEFIRRTWIERGLDPRRITTLPNAIPIDAFPLGGVAERAAARLRLGLPADVPIVLYYGLMHPMKGITTLLDAWRRLGAERRIAGDEPLLVLLGWPRPDKDPTIAAALAKVAPTSYRWFPGQSDVLPFLHAADLVVMPSHVQEAFGRVIIEGLCSGRPVIASDVGGVPEILAELMPQCLVPPGDAAALAGRIMEMLQWRSTDPQLATIGRRWAEERYSASERIPKLEGVLGRFSHRPSTPR